MTTPIKETVSEKPKRGRPSIFTDDWLLTVQSLHPQGIGRRQRQNVAIALQGATVFADDPKCAWILKRKAGSFTIAAELGRIVDDDDRHAIALEICRLKPKVKDAVAMIRRWRLGQSGEGDADALGSDVCKAIDSYTTRHPSTTFAEIEAALTKALEAARQVYEP